MTNFTPRNTNRWYDVFAMRIRDTHVRSVSLFVVAFLCLNPAAVFCLAYCNYHVQISAAHCPLKKQSADCPHSGKTKTSQNTTSIDTGSAKGCVMPVNIIAAPLENRFGVAVDVAVVADLDKIDLDPILLVRSRQLPKFYYRPPPNDRRTERVRNQVFRI